jgi:hypothetical protein
MITEMAKTLEDPFIPDQKSVVMTLDNCNVLLASSLDQSAMLNLMVASHWSNNKIDQVLSNANLDTLRRLSSPFEEKTVKELEASLRVWMSNSF